MADGFELDLFDEALSKVQSLDKQLKELSETSEKSSKRINDALAKVFTTTDDSSRIDSLTNQMDSLITKMKELEKQRKANPNDKSFIDTLNSEAKGAIDEVNRLSVVMEKVRTSSTISPGRDLASLIKQQKLLEKYLSKGYRMEDKKKVKFSNAEVQQIANEKAFIDQLIKERTTATRIKIENAEKEANKEIKIENDKNKKIVENYKRTLREISKLDAEAKKVLLTIEKTGRNAKTDSTIEDIHNRMRELYAQKMEIEKKGLVEVSKLREGFYRDNSVKELEAYRKKEEEKKAERKKTLDEDKREYRRLTSEFISVQRSLDSLYEKKEKYGNNYKDNGSEARLIKKLQDLNAKKIELEKKYQKELDDIRFSFERKREDIILKKSEKEAKKRLDEKKKKEFDYLHSYEGATEFSNKASSINEEKEAIKLLTAARDNLSNSTDKYKEKVKELNDAINKHRVSIETKTKTQEQEKTLLPSIRNEYIRMLKEIDSLSAAYKKLKEAQNNSEDKVLEEQKGAILRRWKDLAKAKEELEKNAQGQLNETYRKYRAERAKEELDEFIRVEKEKAKIAEKEAKEREEEEKSTPEGALALSRNAKTAKEEADAIKYLTKARDGLSESDAKYKEKLEILNAAIDRHNKRLDTIREKSKGVRKAHHNLMDISGQLTRRLALVFSVSQITGYINKLASVRGEFEMQQRALQAIIKDKDEADKLWAKTVELAVKSPFRVKELVTYTKQLAAYRLETDKLYDTNKRLADISAGLGVDMNRLILAYGQVKAANYLRGTELRQFSEAGINVLEELAKYFSEVEGRAIKVGDVFEMVSKRMVSFADVEEVFKRITSEGGVFYNMQEIQSETLKGQLSNLYDSIDIMLNKIGEDNEGSLKGAVKFTREIVENWEEIAFVLKGIIPTFLAMNMGAGAFRKGIKDAGTTTLWFSKSLTGLNNMWISEASSMGKAIGQYHGLNKAQRVLIRTTARVQAAFLGLWGVLKSFAPYAIIAGVMELIRRFTEESRKEAEVRRQVQNVINEDVSSLEKEKDGYIDLVNRLKDANKGTLKRKEIVGRLNSEYGQYLDFVVKEETEISKLADAYDNVVKKMQNKAALESLQKSYSTIEENYRGSLQKAKDEFYKMFESGTVKSHKSDKKFDFILPTKKEIDDIYNILQQKIRELKAEDLDTIREQQTLLQDVIKGYYGEDYYLGVNYDDIELIDIMLKKKEEEERVQKEINALYEETLPSREANLALEKLQTEYIQKRKDIAEDESKTAFEKNKILSQLADKEKMDIIDIKVRFKIISEEEAKKQKEEIINWATETTKSINEAIENIDGYSEEDLARVLIDKSDQKNQSIQEFIKKIKGGWESQNDIIREQIGLKSQGLDADEESLKNAIKLERLYRSVADLLGIEIGYREPVNKAVVDKINAAVSEKFQISKRDALSSQDELLAKNNKELSEHVKILEARKNASLQGQKNLDEEIKKEQEIVNTLTLKGQLLGSYNQKLIDQRTIESVNAKLTEKYHIKDEDRYKSQSDLLAEAKADMDKALAQQDMLNHSKAKGILIDEELKKQVDEDVKYYTTKWKALGGNDDEKEKKGRKAREILEERLRVIKELHDAYKELNETLSENEAREGALSKYGDAFRSAYAGTSLKLDDFYTSEQGMKEFYDKLVRYAKDAKDKIRVELAKGEIVLEEKVKFKIEKDEELNQSIEDLFGDYEISLDLESLNVPHDLAKKLFGLDAATLDEVKKKLESKKFEFIGSDQEKKYEEFLQRISELEDKERMQRLKKFVDFLKETEDEIAASQTKGATDIVFAKQLFDEGKIGAQEYAKIIKNVVREVNEDISNINLEKFKDSSDYIAAMGSLAAYTEKELLALKSRIEDLLSSSSGRMSVDEVKAYMEAIEKIDEQIEENNQQIGESPIERLLEYLNLEKQITLEKQKQKELQEEQQEVQEEIAKESTRLDVLRTTNAGGKNNDLISKSEDKIEGLTEKSEHINGLINKSTAKISALGKKMKDFANGSTKTALMIDTIVTQISNSIKATISLYNDVKDMMDSFGVNTEGKGWAEMTEAMNTLGKVNDKITGAWQSFQSGDIFGAVSNSIGVVTSLIAGINRIHDKKYERRINKELEYIEELQMQYEKLGKAIDEAYGVDTLKKTMELSDQNIKAQIASRKEMIQLEYDKKDTDHDRIKQWNQEIEELQEQQEELHKQQVENMGGTYDYKSAAEGFINAWLDAFNKTGDGLDGLKGHFREFASDLLLKQAVMTGAANIIEPLESMITDALKNDYTIDDMEWNSIDRVQSEQLQKLDEFLRGFYGKYEGILGGKESMSGLQRGIQEITEATAQIIEAYLNSIRLYVADTNNKFTRFLDGYMNAESENPMISQLRIIAKQTTSINLLLDSVVKTGPGQGGAGIKVFMD